MVCGIEYKIAMNDKSDNIGGEIEKVGGEPVGEPESLSNSLPYTPMMLDPRHELIIRHLVVDGLKACDVAAKFEVTDSWISIMRKTPEWSKRIEELKNSANEESVDRLRSFNDKALDAVEECVISTNEHVKVKTAFEILSRNGIGNATSENSSQQPVFNLFLPSHYDRETE